MRVGRSTPADEIRLVGTKVVTNVLGNTLIYDPIALGIPPFLNIDGLTTGQRTSMTGARLRVSYIPVRKVYRNPDGTHHNPDVERVDDNITINHVLEATESSSSIANGVSRVIQFGKDTRAGYNLEAQKLSLAEEKLVELCLSMLRLDPTNPSLRRLMQHAIGIRS